MKIAFITNSAKNVLHYRLPWIKHLQKRGFEVVVFSPNPGEIPGAKSVDWRVDRQGIGIMSLLKSVYELARLLRREDVDVVHTFTPKINVLGTLAARLAGVKIVINNITGLGSLFINKDLYRIRRLMAKVIIKKADYLVFQNIDDQKTLGVESEKEKVFIVPGSGIDMEKFVSRKGSREKDSFREKYGFRKDDKIILYIGRLLYSKGIKELVDSLEYLHKKDSSIKGLFIGGMDSGNPDSISESKIKTWSDKFDFIKFIGPREEVGEFYEIADVFAFPSYREGMPASVLEALCYNLPVVTTDVAGCRQAVGYGKWGDITDPRDSQSLRVSLERVLEGSRDRNTRQYIEDNFSIKKTLESLDILYDDVKRNINTKSKR